MEGNARLTAEEIRLKILHLVEFFATFEHTPEGMRGKADIMGMIDDAITAYGEALNEES